MPVMLEEWTNYFRGSFTAVWPEHSLRHADREGLTKKSTNILTIEGHDSHAVILERPTSILEYEDDELRILREILGEPEHFLAIDYSDETILREILGKLVQHENPNNFVVDDMNGIIIPLEMYLQRSTA